MLGSSLSFGAGPAWPRGCFADKRDFLLERFGPERLAQDDAAPNEHDPAHPWDLNPEESLAAGVLRASQGPDPFSAIVVRGRPTALVPDAQPEAPVLFAEPCSGLVNARYAGHALGNPSAIVLVVAPTRDKSRLLDERQRSDLQACYVLDLRPRSHQAWWAFRTVDGQVTGGYGWDDAVGASFQPIRPRPAELAEPWVFAGANLARAEDRRELKKILFLRDGFQSSGCPAIDLAGLASGQVSVYCAERVTEIELAAASLLLEAAWAQEDWAAGRRLICHSPEEGPFLTAQDERLDGSVTVRTRSVLAAASPELFCRIRLRAFENPSPR